MKGLFLWLASFLFASTVIAQLPNAGMEEWENGLLLKDWITNSKPMTMPPWEAYIVRRDSNAYSGKYAAGFYANGRFRAEASVAFPVSMHPVQLVLWYKLQFAPCVNDENFPEKDTVFIQFDLLSEGQVVDSGRWKSMRPVYDYTRLSIPISMNAEKFDSCRIRIIGGASFGGCGIIAEGTYFLVDELSLRYSGKESCIDSSLICLNCGCYDLYAPVCGCDGKTYGNSCEALNAGVTYWSQGLCKDTANACIDTSKICEDCPCLTLYDPVCGCDGVTYSNSCIAENSGVLNWSKGSCEQKAICEPVFFSWYEPSTNQYHFSYVSELPDSLQCVWSFGDGTSATGLYTSHVFADSSVKFWQVCLELSGVCNQVFCDTISTADFKDNCHAGFDFSIDSDGEMIFSSANGGGDEIEYYWFIGDSLKASTELFTVQIDSNSSEYICQVIVNNTRHCSDTICAVSGELRKAAMALSVQDDIAIAQNITLYPNPVRQSEILHIANLPQPGTKLIIKVRDLNGKQVESYDFSGRVVDTIQLPVVSLAPGIYIIESAGSLVSYGRLVVLPK